MGVPGLPRPLVGFWGVFFEAVAGGPSASSDDGIESGSGGGSKGSGSGSWNAGLPSELVWKALIHGCRLEILRRGWGDAPSGVGVGNTAAVASTAAAAAADAAAASAARGLRRKETSRALWECVRLLLAASPFAEEFAGRGQASAVVATAKALLTATTTEGGGTGASSSLPPVTAAPECAAAPGMLARVLLERVVVLARFRAPEAGPQGVIERLWVGVQRMSAAFSDADRCSGPGVGRGKGLEGGSRRVGQGGDGGATAGEKLLEEREGGRSQSARRLSRRSRAAAPAGEDEWPGSGGVERPPLVLCDLVSALLLVLVPCFRTAGRISYIALFLPSPAKAVAIEGFDRLGSLALPSLLPRRKKESGRTATDIVAPTPSAVRVL